MTLIIQGINRMAELKRTEYGKVDLDYVLGIGGFDLERLFLYSYTWCVNSSMHKGNHILYSFSFLTTLMHIIEVMDDGFDIKT